MKPFLCVNNVTCTVVKPYIYTRSYHPLLYYVHIERWRYNFLVSSLHGRIENWTDTMKAKVDLVGLTTVSLQSGTVGGASLLRTIWVGGRDPGINTLWVPPTSLIREVALVVKIRAYNASGEVTMAQGTVP